MNDYNVRNLLYAEIPEIKRNIRELREKLTNQQINNTALAERIFQLEEKERARSREDHDREAALDFKNAEGLGEI